MARRTKSRGAALADEERLSLYRASDKPRKPDGTYWYRVLRPGESPTELREPDAALSQLPKPFLRQRVARAILTGNKVTSPMIHVTGDVDAAVQLWAERRMGYRCCMVRFPRQAVPADHTIEFEPGKPGHALLQEHDSDP